MFKDFEVRSGTFRIVFWASNLKRRLNRHPVRYIHFLYYLVYSFIDIDVKSHETETVLD